MEGGALRASLACQGAMITFTIFSLFPVAVFDRGKVGRVPWQGNPESDVPTDSADAGGGLAAA